MANLQLNKYFKIWHLALLTTLILLVSIGGFTRLTNSGLSITNWEIFAGILPPLNKESWIQYFTLYKSIPQYQELNLGMSLSEFKYIFWWEYIHRLLARFVSLLYILPLFYFIYNKFIYRHNYPYYFLIFFLFMFQGFLGWYMVKSGLSINVDVSHFRLAAHLVGAIIIITLVYWSYLNHVRQNLKINYTQKKNIIFLLVFLIFIQIIYGAFTSGLDAGQIYQTWPLMNSYFLPEEVSFMSFFSTEAFYDRAHIQLIHRLNAYLIFLIFVAIYISNYKNLTTYLNLPFFLLIFQIILGIGTLITGLNIYMAALHQLTSIFLLMSFIFVIYRLK
ncbi:MAG: COX15/CtaA family protein [Pelagibacteraceae bacterium]